MSYFPTSLMPSKTKQESADVAGNKFIVSGMDHNRIDEEIRAVEKVLLGVQTGGGGTTGSIASCSVYDTLLSILQKLQQIRDTMVDSSSGVVAVKDASLTPTGIIPFPSSWKTTLVSDIPDASLYDEDELSPINEVTLASTAGLPSEGYVTIINDVSFGQSIAVHSQVFSIYSPSRANAKVGKEFTYEIHTTKPATFQVTGLPEGLTFSGNIISGTPVTAKDGVVISIKATAGSQIVNFKLILRIFDTNTPAILDGNGNPTATLTFSTPVGKVFSYGVRYSGAVVSMTALDSVTGLLVPGLTVYGNTITGTSHRIVTYDIDIIITDEMGDSATAVLSLTVGA